MKLRVACLGVLLISGLCNASAFQTRSELQASRAYYEQDGWIADTVSLFNNLFYALNKRHDITLTKKQKEDLVRKMRDHALRGDCNKDSEEIVFYFLKSNFPQAPISKEHINNIFIVYHLKLHNSSFHPDEIYRLEDKRSSKDFPDDSIVPMKKLDITEPFRTRTERIMRSLVHNEFLQRSDVELAQQADYEQIIAKQQLEKLMKKVNSVNRWADYSSDSE